MTAPNYEAAAFHHHCQHEQGPGSSEAELKFLSLVSLQTEEAPFSCLPEGDQNKLEQGSSMPGPSCLALTASVLVGGCALSHPESPRLPDLCALTSSLVKLE